MVWHASSGDMRTIIFELVSSTLPSVPLTMLLAVFDQTLALLGCIDQPSRARARDVRWLFQALRRLFPLPHRHSSGRDPTLKW